MKTFKKFLASVLLTCTFAAAQAQPMSYYDMRENARYLTDRMAYTLSLPVSLLDDLYRINFDYICGVNDYLDDVAYGYLYDDYMDVLYARDYALQRLLSRAQWVRLMTYDYFYRPISFVNNRWRFTIYSYDPYRTRFYYRVPRYYADYRGGHYFRGMHPAAGVSRHGYDNGRRGGNPGYRFERVNDRTSVGSGNRSSDSRYNDNRSGNNRGSSNGVGNGDLNRQRDNDLNRNGSAGSNGRTYERSGDTRSTDMRPNTGSSRGGSTYNRSGLDGYDTQRSSTRYGTTMASGTSAARTTSSVPVVNVSSSSRTQRTSAASSMQRSSSATTPTRSSASGSRSGAGRR